MGREMPTRVDRPTGVWLPGLLSTHGGWPAGLGLNPTLLDRGQVCLGLPRGAWSGHSSEAGGGKRGPGFGAGWGEGWVTGPDLHPRR